MFDIKTVIGHTDLQIQQYAELNAKLPSVRKTPQMLEIEQAHDGQDIRLIIKRIYEETGSQKVTANRLGLEQSTITMWAIRLGIEFTSKPIAQIVKVETPSTAATINALPQIPNERKEASE
jgi:transcriptional regulator with GAF, ATPase, and Fis domain